MANIDVSELLSDPDFCDNFTFIRRVEEVSTKGRSAAAGVEMHGYGSIQPLSGQTLRLMPALALTEDNIEIWTSTPLQTLTSTQKADIVLWKGSQYTVTAVPGDWSNFGAGWTRYVGTLRNLQGKSQPGTP